MPMVVLLVGFMLLCLQRVHPFMEQECYIGSTDGFLAINTTNDQKRHTYKPINPCSMTMVELWELDAIIRNVVL